MVLEDSLIRQFDPMQAYLWKWIPSHGKSGGILSGINLEFFDVGSFHEGQFILQLNLWDKELKRKWNLLNVYGAAHDENRREFLAELARFCNQSDDPFIAGGDFNLVRFNSEKNKGIINRHSSLFNAVIDSQELLDLHMMGGKYTWTNNQDPPTLERLDRCLVSKGWENLFPTAFLQKLPREMSGHNPLILSSGTAPPLTKLSFRFETSW